MLSFQYKHRLTVFSCVCCSTYPIVNPQTTNPCGHSICGHCSDILKKQANDKCHKCRQPRIGFYRNIFAERLLEKVKVKWKGCSEDINVNDVTGHVRHCPEVEVECSLCGQRMKRKGEDDHKDACPKGEITCDCGMKMKREEEGSHTDTCRLTKVHCPPGCGVMVERYNISI